ncbi:MAG: hypothetical protein IPN29_11640 [Saprospiraceae bacterium]|nr:hypothetical protein [Saprospiraceae bacterium]
MRYICIIVFGILISITGVTGQDYQPFFPDFYVNGKKLSLALTGGLRNARFSNIDFNGDGIKDIYAFDHTSGRSLCFINLDESEGIAYRYAPEYENIFPVMKNWAMLYDFNKDGIEDLFCLPTTPGIAGIEVWRGKRQGGLLSFSRMNTPFYNVLAIKAGSQFTNLYNALTDIPGIFDVDDDGDTDILAFEIDGSFLTYYKNLAMERMGWLKPEREGPAIQDPRLCRLMRIVTATLTC